MREILQRHLKDHPAAQVQDLVKLLYQSEFGCGHMIADEASALAYLREECESTPADPAAPLREEIGGGFTRVNLAALPGAGLSPETLGRLFLLSARTPSGTKQGLEEKLTALQEMAREGALPGIDVEEAARFLDEYRRSGCPALHHSEAYREAEKPAYRVIRQEYALRLPLFARICALAKNGPVTVAIDGWCASGKSTLGQLLADVYGANLFHMDDFYIPMREKTPERLAKPGGNTDTERFKREVLSPLLRGEPFTYRVFHCHEDVFGPPIPVTPASVRVVEGVCAMHPDFGDVYDLRVFVTCDPQTQRRRIALRDGEEALAMFERRWIPLEEAYFAACRTREQADLIIET